LTEKSGFTGGCGCTGGGGATHGYRHGGVAAVSILPVGSTTAGSSFVVTAHAEASAASAVNAVNR
jgi:hypothetical protein